VSYPGVEKYFEPYLSPILPEPHETSAVAYLTPKVAALCYDRVWRGHLPDIPREIGFLGISDAEIDFGFVGTAHDAFKNLSRRDVAFALPYIRVTNWIADFIPPGASTREDIVEGLARSLAEGVWATHGVQATPVFTSIARRDAQYKEGDRSVVVAVLQNLEIAREDRLSWDQVLEFRRDRQVAAKYRRLTHWLDSDMNGRSWAYIEDEIGLRLNDYRSAMRKHGIESVIGNLSTMVDSKVLLGGSAAVASLSYASDTTAAFVAGGAVVVAGTALSIAKTLLGLSEARRVAAGEIAFVIEAARIDAA